MRTMTWITPRRPTVRQGRCSPSQYELQTNTTSWVRRDTYNLANQLLVLAQTGLEAFRAGLLLAFDQHHHVHVQLLGMEQLARSVRNGQHRTFVVADTTAIQVAVAAAQLPRVAVPLTTRGDTVIAVSYTHLTLPTNREV